MWIIVDTGGEEGFNLDNLGGDPNEGKYRGSLHLYSQHFPPGKPHQPETSYPFPVPPNYPVPAATPRTPPPPPPPASNVGYIPNFFPMTSNHTPSSYINMPSAAARGAGPGFGIGVGTGALAAGAVLFGDDFMSGFDVPAASRDAAATL